jgi:hypothetical protein
MTRPQRRPHPPAHRPPYAPSYPPYPRGYPRPPQKSRGSQVARVLLIVGVTVLVLVGLAIVATYVFVAAAMSSYGSNK